MAKHVSEVTQGIKVSFLLSGIFSLVINLLMLAPAFYMLQVYDRVIQSHNLYTLFMLTAILIFVLIAMGLLDWVRSRLIIRQTHHIDEKLSGKLFSLSFRNSLITGGYDISAQPLSDWRDIRTFMASSPFFALFDIPWIPVYLLVMYAFHPLFGLIGLISAICLISLALVSERSNQKLTKQANIIYERERNQLASTLRNSEIIEALGMLENLQHKWKLTHNDMVSYLTLSFDRTSTFSSLAKVFRIMVQSLILGLGAYLVIKGQLSAGLMIAGSILLGRALAPLDTIIGAWRSLVSFRQKYARLEKVLASASVDKQVMALPKPKGDLIAQNLFIAAPQQQKPVIRDVSFNCISGDVLAIIGSSGAGKTTLLRGLLGVWPTVAGVIRLDGAELPQYSRQYLGENLGYLPQDVELLDGTISENISRFSELDTDKIIAAAKAAKVNDLILSLPDGYNTRIGAGGYSLSGGQKQRIALARAIYGLPSLVILDEPNSNLDMEGEIALIDTIQFLSSQKVTVILVTHKLTLLNVANKILVLKKGGQVKFGPRNEVLEFIGAESAPLKEDK